MGYYINPRDMSKEAWLNEHGTCLFFHIPEFFRENDSHVVCLVANPGFTAAAICFNQNELKRLAFEDFRLKLWFLVPTEKLLEFCPGLEELADELG